MSINRGKPHAGPSRRLCIGDTCENNLDESWQKLWKMALFNLQGRVRYSHGMLILSGKISDLLKSTEIFQDFVAK